MYNWILYSWKILHMEIKHVGLINLVSVAADCRSIRVRNLNPSITSIEIDHEIFYMSFFPAADSGRVVVSFWQKCVHKYWLTVYRTKDAQKKCFVKLLASYDQCWPGHKSLTQIKTMANLFQETFSHVVWYISDCAVYKPDQFSSGRNWHGQFELCLLFSSLSEQDNQ